MDRMSRWPPRSQNWRIVDGRTILPTGEHPPCESKVRQRHGPHEVSPSDARTSLADGRTDLGRVDGRLVGQVEVLDLLQEGRLARGVEADDGERELVLARQVGVQARQQVEHWATLRRRFLVLQPGVLGVEMRRRRRRQDGRPRPGRRADDPAA
jgi:hypothetical protein